MAKLKLSLKESYEFEMWKVLTGIGTLFLSVASVVWFVSKTFSDLSNSLNTARSAVFTLEEQAKAQAEKSEFLKMEVQSLRGQIEVLKLSIFQSGKRVSIQVNDIERFRAAVALFGNDNFAATGSFGLAKKFVIESREVRVGERVPATHVDWELEAFRRYSIQKSEPSVVEFVGQKSRSK